MKKIIEGKLYDTNTAKEVGYKSNNKPYNDFDYVCETLYIKRTGEFFLHGDGGPMTKYAVYSGDNSWGGGEKIIPMTYETAKKWAEENLSADDYQAEFGEVTEGDETVAIHIRIPAAADNKLRTEAARRGISITALVLDMIDRL